MERLDKYRIFIEKTGDMKVPAMIYATDKILLESGAVSQLKDAARLPGVVKVLATPDIHFGYGVPIGSVVGTKDIVIPAAVGYDINCGMRLLTTPLKREDFDPEEVARSIGRDIPLGEGKRNVRLSRKDMEVILARGVKGVREIAPHQQGRIWEARDEAEEARDIPHIEEEGSMQGDPGAISQRALERAMPQLGTLGGGNHFIEIEVVEEILDEELARQFGLEKNQIVVMVHSGSRGFGHQVGGDYMKIATRMTADQSPNSHLCFLPADSKEGKNYIGAMRTAANFAFVNRHFMAILVRKNFRHIFGNIPMPTVYDVPHNMAKLEEYDGEMLWVHRKGATRAFPPSRMKGTEFAQTGQPVLIPGSMGTSSYVLAGIEESREALYSVNHGAGRCMSRTAASGRSRRGKRRREAAISDEEFHQSMRDILLICADRRTIKEEAPQAYKDIDGVMEAVLGANLAKGVARMWPLAVLKG